MNSRKLKLNIALITLLIYELTMWLFAPDGVSLLKLVVTSLVWISFFVAFYEYIRRYKFFKRIMPKSSYAILTALLIWNLFNVFRSVITQDGPLTTILGNTSASLAILVPFAIAFSSYRMNIRLIHQYFINLLKFGGIVFIVLFAFYVNGLNYSQLSTLLVLLLPVTFLVTILPFETKKNKVLVLACGILLGYTAYLFGGRTMIIRLVLLMISLLGIYIYHKYNFRWILYLSCALLLVPVVLLQQSYVTGESAFEKYMGDGPGGDISIDTRTFLYTEVFYDLITNDQLLVGKGSNGKYYSDYFYASDVGETNYRNNVEVGMLGMLLKGGLIAVFLNITILIMAIWVAFFKTNNVYTVGLGYILVIHTILLFLENVIIYSSYNFFIWFVIGACLSKQIRNMTNRDIYLLLNPIRIVK